jgi:Glycoside hydrolase 97.
MNGLSGTITNTEARKVTVPLSFLEKGKKYVASIYADDDAVKTRTHVRVSKYIVNGDNMLNLSVKASGGVAMHFVPATAKEIKSLPKLKKNNQL